MIGRILLFLTGVLVGAGVVKFYNPSPRQTAIEDRAIAQRLYNELEKYDRKERSDLVIAALQELIKGKRELLPENEFVEALVEMATSKSQKIADENLQKANEKLSALIAREDTISVVPGYVCVEVLEKGSGAEISSEDVVSIHFKEFTPEGTLIKSTEGLQPFRIPLAETIRGFKAGFEKARVGEKRRIYIHPDWGFGKIGLKEPNQLLTYEVTILEKVE